MSQNGISIFVRTLRVGGSEKQSVYLAKAISEKKNVLLIVYDGDNIDKIYLKELKSENIELYILRKGTINKYIELYKILKSRNIKFLFNYLTFCNTVGCLIGKLVGIPNIYNSFRSTHLPQHKLIIERIIHKYFSSSTICNSYSGAEYLIENYFISSKIIVIPNCIKPCIPKLTVANDDIIKIISVGRFVPSKDYKTALLAISELKKVYPNISYIIIGYGKLLKHIEEWILELNLINCVNIIHDHKKVEPLLKTSDIYLSTSTYEGMSNSIMEAMNVALPIIATNVGDNKRLVIDNYNGFLHELNDFKAIANSLKTLCLNYDLRVDFGRSSKNLIDSKYSIEKFKLAYEALIIDKDEHNTDWS